MKQRPKPPQKPNGPGLFHRFFVGNVYLILITLGLMGIVAYYLNKGKPSSSARPGTASNQDDDGVQTQLEEGKVPSRRMGEVPRRTSTKEEKMNVTESDITPEFVKEHTAMLKRTMDVQILGGELTLKVNTDPKQIEEIKLRLIAAKRFKAKLDAVNPNDKSTWFWTNDQPKTNSKVVPDNDFYPIPKN